MFVDTGIRRRWQQMNINNLAKAWEPCICLANERDVVVDKGLVGPTSDVEPGQFVTEVILRATNPSEIDLGRVKEGELSGRRSESECSSRGYVGAEAVTDEMNCAAIS
jgi:hypothetical protein